MIPIPQTGILFSSGYICMEGEERVCVRTVQKQSGLLLNVIKIKIKGKKPQNFYSTESNEIKHTRCKFFLSPCDPPEADSGQEACSCFRTWILQSIKSNQSSCNHIHMILNQFYNILKILNDFSTVVHLWTASQAAFPNRVKRSSHAVQLDSKVHYFHNNWFSKTNKQSHVHQAGNPAPICLVYKSIFPGCPITVFKASTASHVECMNVGAPFNSCETLEDDQDR